MFDPYTNCASLVAVLLFFSYERVFILSLSDNSQADVIEAFKSISRYLDGLLNIDTPYFKKKCSVGKPNFSDQFKKVIKRHKKKLDKVY